MPDQAVGGEGWRDRSHQEGDITTAESEDRSTATRITEILTFVLLLDLGGGPVLSALYLPLENLGAAGALHVLPLTLALVGPVPNLQYPRSIQQISKPVVKEKRVSTS
jgi:hypothetical protein